MSYIAFEQSRSNRSSTVFSLTWAEQAQIITTHHPGILFCPSLKYFYTCDSVSLLTNHKQSQKKRKTKEAARLLKTSDTWQALREHSQTQTHSLSIILLPLNFLCCNWPVFLLPTQDFLMQCILHTSAKMCLLTAALLFVALGEYFFQLWINLIIDKLWFKLSNVYSGVFKHVPWSGNVQLFTV